ncbi:hypothetical protein GCM10010341_25750 [Streptomyces noursei]|nr:hypothetical protein GCM10010341_25750 [Streptomyces noursei]
MPVAPGGVPSAYQPARFRSPSGGGARLPSAASPSRVSGASMPREGTATRSGSAAGSGGAARSVAASPPGGRAVNPCATDGWGGAVSRLPLTISQTPVPHAAAVTAAATAPAGRA